VEALLKDEKGTINGVEAKDLLTNETFTLEANLVISATGVSADDIHRMDDPKSKPTIRPSQGVHIVLDHSFLQSTSAIMIPKTDDGRVLFAIPWYGKVVAGTTDTPLDEITMEPRALDEEIDFILRTAGHYFTRKPTRDDILCVFAGLRPLAANPDNPSATKEVSRRHKITLSKSGLLSIIGGKWTSYRRMAEETLDRAIKAGKLPPAKCRTKNFLFYHNATLLRDERLKIYGDSSWEIEKIIEKNPETARLVHPRLPYTEAEIIWICRNEMPVTIEDVLARRTRALLLDTNASVEMAQPVAGIMASEMGYNEKWKEVQVEEYHKLSLNYL
jgi:glycerol-3-phosphate dehydrogenase